MSHLLVLSPLRHFGRSIRFLLGDLAQLLVEALFVVVRLNLAGGLLELLDLRKFLA
jgi:hypothetical protein